MAEIDYGNSLGTRQILALRASGRTNGWTSRSGFSSYKAPGCSLSPIPYSGELMSDLFLYLVKWQLDWLSNRSFAIPLWLFAFLPESEMYWEIANVSSTHF